MKATGCDLVEIGGRIRAAREHLGLNRPKAATLFGCSVRGLENNEWGRSEGGMCLIGALSREGINANWLLTGDGPMLLADLAPKPAPAPVPLRINVDALAAAMDAVEKLEKPGTPREALHRKAARFYAYMVDEEMITETGVGPGVLKNTA